MAAQSLGHTAKIKHRHTTKYIKHLAGSANFKVCTFIENFNSLTGRFSEMPNVSYTWTLTANVKKDSEIQ